MGLNPESGNWQDRGRFQFLGRNSVHWDPGWAGRSAMVKSFNSSVGILSIGTSKINQGVYYVQFRFNSSVGILSIGTPKPLDKPLVIFGFNSSVGILSIGTCLRQAIGGTRRCGFNSSVGILSIGTPSGERTTWYTDTVSIPRSEFCPLGLGRDI